MANCCVIHWEELYVQEGEINYVQGIYGNHHLIQETIKLRKKTNKRKITRTSDAYKANNTNWKQDLISKRWGSLKEMWNTGGKVSSCRRNRSCTVTPWGRLLRGVGTLAFNPFVNWLGSHSSLIQMTLSSRSLPGPWPAHTLRRHVGSQLTLGGNSEVKILGVVLVLHLTSLKIPESFPCPPVLSDIFIQCFSAFRASSSSA